MIKKLAIVFATTFGIGFVLGITREIIKNRNN